ncbi:MAG: efflux RND transporter permease subunit [Mucinivorans sp.]
MKLKASGFSIIVSFICLSLLGISLLPMLTVRLTPSYKSSQINVSFSMNGQSPRVVESKVTSHIESMLNRIEGVENINSTSSNGYGSVSISLDKNADIDLARFEASTIIRQLWPSLPLETSYPQISSGTFEKTSEYPFLTYTVNAPSAPNLIYNYAEKVIKPKLSTIEGISNIDISGATPMEWNLEYDYHQLTTLGLNVSDIQNAVSRVFRGEFIGMGSVVDEKGRHKSLNIMKAPEQKNNFDPSKIIVKKVDGRVIYLNELVKTTYQPQTPRGFFRINGLNSIYVSLYANENSNQLDLAEKVKAQLLKINKAMPVGYEMHNRYDATEYIKAELSKIEFRSVLTVAILLLFVFLISSNLRYLALILISIATTFSIAITIYYFLGIEIQLYSLAGLTISLGLITDNIIVMTEHLLKRRNMTAFTAILAASLTTISSMSVIFFVDDSSRISLLDFSYVIIINLTISLFVVLLLVPALADKLNIYDKEHHTVSILKRLGKKPRSKRSRAKRLIRFNRLYSSFLRFGYRHRKGLFTLIILSFGLPFFMLPDKLDDKTLSGKIYNATLGSAFYTQNIKGYITTLTGGSLRLFMQSSYANSSISERGETRLNVYAYMPNGATLEEMNETVKQMEAHITSYNGVKQFHTNVNSPNNASIDISFTKEGERDGVHHILKSSIISKTIELGNANWSVTGLGDGFNNMVAEESGRTTIEMYGYNYDELMSQAKKLKNKLLTHQRIKDVSITPNNSYYKERYEEFVFDTDPEKLIHKGLNIGDLYSSVSPIFGRQTTIGSVYAPQGGLENIVLTSKQSNLYDVWNLNNNPLNVGYSSYRITDLATVTKEQTPQNVVKINQQYRIYLNYDYVGDVQQGYTVLQDELEKFNYMLPLGYSATSQNASYEWEKKMNMQFLLIFPIIAIIFFVCSILFNSLKRPFAVMMTIPISYIGIFLTFSIFNINFGQGGFAAFVLLSGLSVNSSIYVLNDYDSLCRKTGRIGLSTYIKSFNAKIVPIMLTVCSTILGFIPFVVEAVKDDFWFSLAVGTMGGLIFSMVGLIFYLPLMIGIGKNHKTGNRA